MVLTSHNQLGNAGLPTGFWLEDFAAPYFVFRGAGIKLALASPKGGQPPLDPKSDLPEYQTRAMARLTKGSRMSAQCQPMGANDTLPLSRLGPELQTP